MKEDLNAELERQLPAALRNAVRQHPWKKLLQDEEARIRQGTDDAPLPGSSSGSTRKLPAWRRAGMAAALVLVIAVAGYFVWQEFLQPPPPLAIEWMILPKANTTADTTAAENFEKGRVAFSNKKFSLAASYLEQIPASSAGFYHDAQFLLAHCYHQLGEYTKAIAIYERFLENNAALMGEIDGENQREDKLRWNLVIACWGSGQLERARNELKILKSLPDLDNQVKENIVKLERQL